MGSIQAERNFHNMSSKYRRFVNPDLACSGMTSDVNRFFFFFSYSFFFLQKKHSLKKTFFWKLVFCFFFGKRI